MAAVRWRLRRIEAMEAAIFKKAIKHQQELLGTDADPSEVQDAAYAEVAESKSLCMLSRHQSQLRRAYEKAWKELELIQQHRSHEVEKDDADNHDAENDEQINLQNEPKIRIAPRIFDPLFNAPWPGTALGRI